MNYETLKAAVIDVIKTNGNEEITGQILQDVLVAIINSLGADYQFAGVATPETEPGTLDQRVFYIASAVGEVTFPNFGPLTIEDEICILKWDSAWSVEKVIDLTAEATEDSEALITSGGVYSALQTLAQEVEDALADLEEEVAQKIDKSDAETLAVGSAQGILAQSAVEAFFTYRETQARGAGAALIQTIKGKTIAWNQLVDEDTTEVTIPSGHKYFAIIGGTASVATSDGTAIAVTGGVDIVTDLTLLGLGDLTSDQFRALYPELYHPYNAGKLRNNDAEGLETIGFNRWDEEWELGDIIASTGALVPATDRIRCKNPIPVFANTTYYCNSVYVPWVIFYDSDLNFIDKTNNPSRAEEFTTPSNAAYIRFYCEPEYGTTYKNDICINISDASRNGEYEPYWKREIQFRIKEVTGIPVGGTEADRVTIFPEGAAGAGSVNDLFFVENGVTKARKTMLAEVDLGDLNYTKTTTAVSGKSRFTAPLANVKQPASGVTPANAICSKYLVVGSATTYQAQEGVSIETSIPNVTIYIESFSDSTPTQFKAAMTGVKLIAEAATPSVYTDLRNADGTPFELPLGFKVEQDGTEKVIYPEGATEPSAPFSAEFIYPVNPIETCGESLKNLLEAMKTAGVISAYTMTWNESTQQYEFTITA